MVIQDLHVNIECVGEGQAVVLLHGWGQNVRLKPLCDSILLAQMELAEVESCVYNCIQGGRDA